MLVSGKPEEAVDASFGSLAGGAMNRRLFVCAVFCLASAWATPQASVPGPVPDTLEEAHRIERSEPARALELIDSVQSRAEAGGDVPGLGAALLHRAHWELIQGNHRAALEAALRGRGVLEPEFGHLPETASILGTLAVLYEQAGLYPEALELHSEAIARFRALDDPGRLSASLLNYGNLLDSVDDLDGAEAAYSESVQIKRAQGIARGLGTALSNLGWLRNRQNRPREALAFFDQALEQLAEEENPQARVNTRVSKARALIMLQRFEEATANINAAAIESEASGYRAGLALVAEIRIEMMLAQGSVLDRNEALRALALNAQAIDWLEGGDASRLGRLLRQRADVAEMAREPGLALAALRRLESLEEAKRSEDSARRFALLSAHYDAERKAAEIALLKERDATQQAVLQRARLARNSLVGGALLLGLVLLMLYWRVRQRQLGERALAQHNRELSLALREAERQRQAAEEAGRQNSELLRIATEDLRAPLMQVLGNSERLLLRASSLPELRREAAAIADSAQHLVQVVSNLVDSAELDHRERLRYQPLDLAAIAGECVEVWSLRAAEKRQRLDPDLAGPLPIEGDSLRLRQAIENLISNAIKFTPPNRGVTLRAYAEGGMAVIEVEDEGPGLRKQDSDRLFGRMQRLSAKPTAGERSTGLGLSLVRRIAELHGGSVEAQNLGNGQGSRFRILIPLAGSVPQSEA
jgi:signal transduction histidine kinase